MPDRLEWFDVTIPAGTLKAAPITVPLLFLQGEVVEIDVKVLDGPCGTVGFFIAAGGSQYVPRTAGSFIIPNDDYFTWPMQNAINSGSWALTGYNLDSWDHLVQVAFQVNEDVAPPSSTTAGLGSSAAQVATAAATFTPVASAGPDPLSPDALIASVPADVITSAEIPAPETVMIGDTVSAGSS